MNRFNIFTILIAVSFASLATGPASAQFIKKLQKAEERGPGAQVKSLPGDQYEPKTLPGDQYEPKSLPGDQFEPKTLPSEQIQPRSLPGDQFEPNSLPGDQFESDRPTVEAPTPSPEG